MSLGPLHVAHLAVDSFNDIVVNKEFGDVAVFGRFWTGWRLEAGGDAEEAFGQRNGQINGVGAVRRSRRHRCAGQLSHVGHGLVHIFTVTPAQMAAPVQFETLSMAVCCADGQSITGEEVRSARTAFGQSLSFI